MPSSRTDALLQLWQIRHNGWKPTSYLELHYQSGQADPPEYLLRLANHMYYPAATPYPNPTGRITVSVADAYWQGVLQAKEIYNDDPHSIGMDATTDAAYASLHGFTVESIPAGAYRVIAVRINGTGLTFADQLVAINFAYPTAA